MILSLSIKFLLNTYIFDEKNRVRIKLFHYLGASEILFNEYYHNYWVDICEKRVARQVNHS